MNALENAREPRLTAQEAPLSLHRSLFPSPYLRKTPFLAHQINFQHHPEMRPIALLQAIPVLGIVGVQAIDNRLLYTIPRNQTIVAFRTWYVFSYSSRGEHTKKIASRIRAPQEHGSPRIMPGSLIEDLFSNREITRGNIQTVRTCSNTAFSNFTHQTIS